MSNFRQELESLLSRYGQKKDRLMSRAEMQDYISDGQLCQEHLDYMLAKNLRPPGSVSKPTDFGRGAGSRDWWCN
jgi:hypothetical protein